MQTYSLNTQQKIHIIFSCISSPTQRLYWTLSCQSFNVGSNGSIRGYRVPLYRYWYSSEALVGGGKAVHFGDITDILRQIGCITYTVGQRRWRTAVPHLPTWRPPNQANKARPGLVFYNHHTLTQVYTQIGMGRRNSVPERRDFQSLNFVTRTLCIFDGRWRTQRCEVEDSVMFGFSRWRTAISDARLDRFIKIYFVCWTVLDWSQTIILLTRHKHALTEAALWLQINCKHIFVQLWWSMWK